MAIDLWPGDRVMWRKVAFTVNSTWQDGTVDLWDERTKRIIGNVKASELEVIYECDLIETLQDRTKKLWEAASYSRADAEAEYDEWMKQAIMDDKAQ